MSLTKTLLAGAAVCALCTAPALAAAPSIHLGGLGSAMTMKVGSNLHAKTNAANPNLPSFTQTVTFTATLSRAASKEVPVLLWAETWYSSASCTEPSNEKLMTPRKTALAHISHGTSTGVISACGSTVFTFYGPVYTLEHKGKTDAFTSDLTAKNFVGYNLKLVANTDLTITK